MPKDFKPLFTWRSAICDSGLKPTTRHVALTLSLHMNERGGSCFPGAALLSEETGLSERAVRQHLAQLVEAGWLSLVEAGGIKGERKRANAYAATTPAPPAPVIVGTPAGGDSTPAPDDTDPCTSCTPGRQESFIEVTNAATAAPSSRTKKPRERDQHFDALVEVFGPASTHGRAAFYAKTANALRAADATPAQITVRGRRLLSKGWTDAGPAALEKHWDALAGNARPSRRDPAGLNWDR